MPYKDPAKQKAAQHDWYVKRKAELVAKNRAQRQIRRAMVDEYKLEHGCNRCGYKRCTAALEFHHVGETKNFAVAEGVLGCKNIDEIKAEVALCELVCANCHREETAKGWFSQ